MAALAISCRDRSQQGLALVVVMWLVAALTLLVTGLSATTRADLRGTQNLRLFAEHEALGDAVIRLAAAQMLVEPIEDRPLHFSYLVEGHELQVEVLPASAFVNLNLASEALLRDTLQFGADVPEHNAQVLAERIVDWRDADDAALPNGAERDAYEAAGSSFRPRNGPFESVDDLIQVLGMSLNLHDKMRGLVTVSGSSSGVDPRFAPPEVLMVLAAGNPAAALRIVDARRSTDPLSDMTGLTQEHLAMGQASPYRFEASRQEDGVRLVRVRWIELGRGGANSALPWHELFSEPVRSHADSENGRGADGI